MLIKALRAHEFGLGENRIVKPDGQVRGGDPAPNLVSGLGFRGSGY